MLFVWASLFAHVLMTALWMGGGMYMIHIVRPSLGSLPPDRRREALDRVLAAGDPLHMMTGWLAVFFGGLSGIALNRYREALTVDTRWGWAIAVSVVISLAILAPGTWRALRVARGLAAGRTLSEITGRPPLDPRPLARLWRIDRVGWLRTIGFIVALALMSLARLS